MIDRRPPQQRADFLRLVTAVVVFAVTAIVSRAELTTAERRLFDAVNGLPDLLEPLLWTPMQFGSLAGPFLVAATVWLIWRDWRPPLEVLVVGVIAWEAAKVAKAVVERGRPADVLSDIITRVGTPVDGLGFPSGHSTVAFATACVLSPYLSRLARWIAYSLATIVAFARVHNGAHLPLDAIGGAALGMALALAYRVAVGAVQARQAG